jgi:hypothetical protein
VGERAYPDDGLEDGGRALRVAQLSLDRGEHRAPPAAQGLGDRAGLDRVVGRRPGAVRADPVDVVGLHPGAVQAGLDRRDQAGAIRVRPCLVVCVGGGRRREYPGERLAAPAGDPVGPLQYQHRGSLARHRAPPPDVERPDLVAGERAHRGEEREHLQRQLVRPAADRHVHLAGGHGGGTRGDRFVAGGAARREEHRRTVHCDHLAGGGEQLVRAGPGPGGHAERPVTDRPVQQRPGAHDRPHEQPQPPAPPVCGQARVAECFERGGGQVAGGERLVPWHQRVERRHRAGRHLGRPLGRVSRQVVARHRSGEHPAVFDGAPQRVHAKPGG